MGDTLADVIAYHQATKHHLRAYARGPGHLDWATQPNPFRRYEGAPLIRLNHVPPTPAPLYEEAFVTGRVAPQPFSHRTVSQLFTDSLALSAWKQAGDASWALRINPSSGNLHPTEGYLVCGPIEGLCTVPMVCHYAPADHALERRAEFPLTTWHALTAEIPQPVLLVGLTSIHWREAWKYGERAYRYCQHDVGHAMAAVGLAAAGLGWQATLLDDLGTDEVGALLGVGDAKGTEPEAPDCMLVIYPQGHSSGPLRLPRNAVAAFADLPWCGRPNLLSSGHVNWPIIDRVSAAARKPPTEHGWESERPAGPALAIGTAPIPFRQIVFQRRSAVAFDGRSGITRSAFYQILAKTLAGPNQIPFRMLPWTPRIHLVLFVHRVQDLDAGIYMLVRNADQSQALRAAMKSEFDWQTPEACPDGLPLFRLLTGDARQVAEQVSCHQAIAADGCFSLGMIAEFQRPLERYGGWLYPRLHWETGVVGQVLYLEAEATGIRGTGIGCFFDDTMHRLLGLTTLHYQSLYHFTLGGPVDDPRLRTLPPYPAR